MTWIMDGKLEGVKGFGPGGRGRNLSSMGAYLFWICNSWGILNGTERIIYYPFYMNAKVASSTCKHAWSLSSPDIQRCESECRLKYWV